MQKSLNRIVVLLLVPCLAGDPSTVSALVNPLSRGRERVGARGDVTRPTRFEEEALAERAIAFREKHPELMHFPLIGRLLRSAIDNLTSPSSTPIIPNPADEII